MGYCLTAFTYFLLSAGVLTQVVAFLTSHLQDNDINDQHKGLFIDCSVGKCVWFNINDFSNKTGKRGGVFPPVTGGGVE